MLDNFAIYDDKSAAVALERLRKARIVVLGMGVDAGSMVATSAVFESFVAVLRLSIFTSAKVTCLRYDTSYSNKLIETMIGTTSHVMLTLAAKEADEKKTAYLKATENRSYLSPRGAGALLVLIDALEFAYAVIDVRAKADRAYSEQAKANEQASTQKSPTFLTGLRYGPLFSK